MRFLLRVRKRLFLQRTQRVSFVPCVNGSPLARVFFDGDARLVGVAMCPAYWCGAAWPLALMLSADQVPVKNTHSRDALAQVGCRSPDQPAFALRRSCPSLLVGALPRRAISCGLERRLPIEIAGRRQADGVYIPALACHQLADCLPALFLLLGRTVHQDQFLVLIHIDCRSSK
jgi:hypothetical protein